MKHELLDNLLYATRISIAKLPRKFRIIRVTIIYDNE